VLRRANRYGVGTDLIQVDPLLPTGFVRVHVDERGNGSYEICEPVAWERHRRDRGAARAAPASARDRVRLTRAAKRDDARATIERLWKVASHQRSWCATW
jgi:fructokinase